MRFYKLRVTPNATSVASTFNKHFKPEIIREMNDPFHVEWIQGDGGDVLVGEQASRIQETLIVSLTRYHQALRIADPVGQGYSVQWPILGSQFNARDYASLQLILSDIETILRIVIKEKLNIEANDYHVSEQSL
jgi:actin-related protein 8